MAAGEDGGGGGWPREGRRGRARRGKGDGTDLRGESRAGVQRRRREGVDDGGDGGGGGGGNGNPEPGSRFLASIRRGEDTFTYSLVPRVSRSPCLSRVSSLTTSLKGKKKKKKRKKKKKKEKNAALLSLPSSSSSLHSPPSPPPKE